MRTALTGTFAWLLLGCATMTPRPTLAEHNAALIHATFEAWRAGTGRPFDLLADDATWVITGRSQAAGTYTSKAAFLQEVIAPFNARMRIGIRPVIRSIHADGDMVVVFFDAAGVAADGIVYENTYAWFMTVRDDRVVHVSAFYDAIAFDDLWRRVTPSR